MNTSTTTECERLLANQEAIVLEVDGMMCMKNCGTTVQNALRGVAGVASAVVTYDEHIATITMEPNSTVDPQELVDVLDMIGFNAAVRRPTETPPGNIIQLGIDGMMCMKNCGTTVQNALRIAIGVKNAIVDYEKSMATVTVYEDQAGLVTVNDLIEIVECVGFDAYPYNHGERCRRQLAAKAKKNQQLETEQNTAPIVAIAISSAHPRAFFAIQGMTCAACVKAIEDVLRRHTGIIDVRVGLINAKAEVVFDRSIILNESEDIAAVVRGAGYGATYINTFDATDDSIEAKYLLNHGADTGVDEEKKRSLEIQMKEALPGVVSVHVHEQIVTVHLQQLSATGPRNVLEWMNRNGYPSSICTKRELPMSYLGGHEDDADKWCRLLKLCLIFSTPAMFVHMVLSVIPSVHMWLMTKLLNALTIHCLIMFLLSTPVQFGIGYRFYVAAYKGLQHGLMGMDFLIVVGTTASYLYSFVSMIGCTISPTFHGHHFFESSTMLLSFVTLGKYLEAKAKKDTIASLDMLIRMQPEHALLIEENNVDRTIPIELVQRGDLLRLLPGSRIPTDGIIESGASTCDESMLTGESMPVRKTVGDVVFGSTLNQSGVLVMKSSCVGNQNTLSQICSLIENAQMEKAPIQAIADSFASYFAPFIIVVAIVTFFTWFILLSLDEIPLAWRRSLGISDTGHDEDFFIAILFSISTIVISCPCALGLATPTAVTVGTGVGSKYGILIKGGKALETARLVDTVVFDKTGTLTRGRPTVTEVIVDEAANISARELLYYAGSVEAQSEHVLGKAIVIAAKEQEKLELTTPTDFHIVPGRGLQAWVPHHDDFHHHHHHHHRPSSKGSTSVKEMHTQEAPASPPPPPSIKRMVHVAIGNAEWLEERKLTLPTKMEKCMWEFENEGKTVVSVVLDNVVVGLIVLADTLRPEAMDTIRHLKAMGVTIWLITGDNLRTATSTACTLGIHHVKAVALPGQKVEQIKEIQSQINPHTRTKRIVMMVGDGINDAPALTQADVGLAIGAGTDIALAQADMVLIKSDIRDVVTALDLSRVIFQRIKINLFASMIYNMLSIPLAAGLFFPLFQRALPPACAGIAMALSSISVILSSLWLKRYKPPRFYDNAAGHNYHYDDDCCLHKTTHTSSSSSSAQLLLSKRKILLELPSIRHRSPSYEPVPGDHVQM